MAATDTPEREELAQRIRHFLAPRDVREVSMFGELAFMVDDRMAVAAGRTGELLVRTNPADYDRHLERGAAQAYMGTGRPMGAGWLRVPADRLVDDSELEHWVTVGMAG